MASTPAVKVRFAPSPTGSLHVGGARTALFNWLYAKRHGGRFILRIEDTDLKRSTPESLQEILESLRWLGLDWDEEPVFQSKRFEVYRELARDLLEQGKAREDNGAIVCPMPAKEIVVQDMIYGTVRFDASLLKDQVLLKSDGSPAYNFACVVDDAHMAIDPVLRGEDHLSNTPKQVMLYEALQLPVPRFAHVPLILGADRSRLSKRHGATSVKHYRDKGYLPEALLNYLVLLGWSPGNNEEVFSIKELIQRFDLDGVMRKGAVFSPDKLLWMNSVHMKKRSSQDMISLARPFLEREVSVGNGEEQKFDAVLGLVRDRMRVLEDISWLGGCFFREPAEFDAKAYAKHLRKKEILPVLKDLVAGLQTQEPFDVQSVERIVRGGAEAHAMKAAPVIQAMRVALTGSGVSAGLFETMAILGKNTCVDRLQKAVKKVRDELGK